MNLPTVDWNSLCDDYEQRVIDLFDHHMLRQVVDFRTCANNTIDLVFQRKCNILAEKDNDFTKVYNITNHHAVKMRLDCLLTKGNPYLRSIGVTGELTIKK